MDIVTKYIDYIITKGGTALLQVETSLKNAQILAEEWKNKECLIEFGKKKKRSLNANSYYHSLLNQLADCLNISKEELHFDMLKHYGQSEIVSVRSDIKVKGFFRYYEEIGTGKVGDNVFSHYKVFKGSSEMDSREMQVLIKGIESECITQDIPILDDIKLKKLIEAWKL